MPELTAPRGMHFIEQKPNVKPSKRMPKGRRCRKCSNPLSTYNKARVCWACQGANPLE